jgi:hypothetical protein
VDRRARRWLRLVTLLLACGLTASAGCDRAWQAFEQIELGEPLPDDNLLSAEGCVVGRVRVWQDYLVVHIPGAMKGWSLRAVADDSGNIVGKHYLANDFAHLLVFRTATWRWVMEVQVPAEAFHDPPAEWVLTRDPLSTEPPPANVLEYLVMVNALAEAKHAKPRRQAWFLDYMTSGLFTWFGFVLWDHGGEPEMEELARRPWLFAGVTGDGYDRQWQNADGGTCRIQNLGDRRIRIESDYSGIFDTIRVVYWKKWTRFYTYPNDP